MFVFVLGDNEINMFHRNSINLSRHLSLLHFGVGLCSVSEFRSYAMQARGSYYAMLEKNQKLSIFNVQI